MSKSKTDLIEEMLDSMSSELGAELSECEATEFNGHTVVLVAARDIGVPGRRGVLYVDGLERAHADAVSILAVPKARPVGSQPHDNLRDNIGQAIKDAFDEIDAEITGFDIHDARDIDIFTDKVMKVLVAGLPVEMSDDMRRFIEGMSVSVDVSTGEHDAGNRYFGTVTEVMDDGGDKHGVTLLVQNAKPNFTAPAANAQATPITNASLDDEEIIDAIKGVVGFEQSQVDKWRNEALIIGKAVLDALRKKVVPC